jgi:hypothetical protein
MSSDARSLPLRDAPLGGQRAGGGRRSWPMGVAGALSRASAGEWAGAVSLLAILAGSLLIVVMAADRPSLLSPTTHANFFPGWMAGPLGGIWPGLPRGTIALRYLFTGAIVAMYGSYLLALRYAPRLPPRWAIGAVVMAHGVFLLAPPLALTDVFNYINYGRMEVVHHLNPYTTIPILESHSDPSYVLSNWHQLLSPYGPLFTLLTFAVVPLGVAASFWALKVLLAAASLAAIALVWRCARLLGRDPVAAIVLVGLNPIVLVWGLGGDHNDSLMVLCIVFGFYLLLRARGAGAHALPAPGTAPAPAPAGAGTAGTPTRTWAVSFSRSDVGAGAAFMTAVAIKASAAVLLPIVLAGLLRTRARALSLAAGMAIAAAVLGAASVIAFGLHIPDLNTQSRLVTNISVPNLVGLAVGSGGESESLHVLFSALLAAVLLACCVQAWRTRSSLTACGWASAALLVTLSWVLPWYVLWVLPLAALSRSRRLRAAVIVLGAYLIIAWSPASILLWNAIGFHPEKTPLGRLHQRYVKELLN